jgi:hypothetical protein
MARIPVGTPNLYKSGEAQGHLLIDSVHPSPTAMARIGIHILAANYATFKALMPSEEKLGKDCSAWIKRRLEEDSRSGESVKNVTVPPEDFRLYCVQIGQKPT